MGINIRSGSHYTSFVVYDFDGDGKCEIAFRTSEGTRFGDGKQITDVTGKVNDYRQKDSDGKAGIRANHYILQLA
jgi:rhamnogalacturonan endolyase